MSNEFPQAVLDGGNWDLIQRTDGKVHKRVNASELWDKIAHAAWAVLTQGYNMIALSMNGIPALPVDINASNPCSEYMFLDDMACNLASMNLMQFRHEDGRFDIGSFEHAVRLWTLALEISVMMAQFPSKEIAQGSYDYRTLGLGFANIGGMLMAAGYSYDSDEARHMWCHFCVMTGRSYATSAEIASELGTFPLYEPNAENMLRVMRNHCTAAHGKAEGYEGLTVKPVPLAKADCPDQDMVAAAAAAWDDAVALEKHGS